jgi:hypothetical protein
VPGGSVFFRAATSACDRCSIAIERKRAGDFPDALNSHVKRRHDRYQDPWGQILTVFAIVLTDRSATMDRMAARISGAAWRHGSTWWAVVYPPPAFFWW